MRLAQKIKDADAGVAIAPPRKRATQPGTRVCIAIVDSGANLKAFYHMDDAWVGSIDIAIKKAKTAVFPAALGLVAIVAYWL